jgi:holin-like protein
MIAALTMLLLCQLAGELLTRLLRLPVPGPVLGMLLLFALLLFRPKGEGAIRESAGALLRNLSLLFVPAGVGLIRHAGRLRQEWIAIAVAIVVSTAATLVVSALVFFAVSRATEADR